MTLSPIDFRRREWVPHSGWPITRRDLDPYYAAAQLLVEIGPPTYDPLAWQDDKHRFPEFQPERMSSRRHSIPRDALEKIIAAAGTLPRGADIALLSEDIYSAGIQVGLRDEIHSTAAFDARVKDFSRLQSLMHQVAKLFGENGRFKRRHVESSFILNALEDLPAAVDMLNHVRAGRNAPPTIEADLKSLLRIAHRSKNMQSAPTDA